MLVLTQLEVCSLGVGLLVADTGLMIGVFDDDVDPRHYTFALILEIVPTFEGLENNFLSQFFTLSEVAGFRDTCSTNLVVERRYY